VEQVRAGGHAGFLVGQELDEAVADATLARVRLNHVLEHLNDPRPALSQIRRKIAPGGRIHIATPNPAGIGSVLFRTRWFSLDCPRHLLLYPPRLVSDLLQDSGFRHTRVIHQVVSKDIVRSWRYLVHDLKRIRHDEIEVAVPDEAGSAVMRLPGKLAALLSISDRFHVFADA
jgi:SAM-dependent methyltransferase